MEFINIVSKKTKSWGYSLYRQNDIVVLNKISETEYKAKLKVGNDICNVYIDTIEPLSSKCDCNNKEDSICIHMMATFFYAFPEEALKYENVLKLERMKRDQKYQVEIEKQLYNESLKNKQRNKSNIVNDEDYSKMFKALEEDFDWEEFLMVDFKNIGDFSVKCHELELEKIKDIKSDLGLISDGEKVIDCLERSLICDIIRKGLFEFTKVEQFLNSPKGKKELIIAAEDHDEYVTCIVGKVNNYQLEKAIEANEIIIDKECNILDNINKFFLNGQTEYPKDVLLNILKTDERFNKCYEYYKELNIESLVESVKEKLLLYLEIKDVTFDLILFSWMTGDMPRIFALAYPFKRLE